MSKIEHLRTIQTIIKNMGEVATQPYIEDNELTDFNVKIIVQDTSKVIWKSSKTHFTKIYDKEIRGMMENKVMDLIELGLLTLLSTYMDYENNELMLDENVYMTQKDIIQISGLGKTKVIEVLKKFEENKIIFTKPHPKDKRKKIYYLSPNLFYKGQKIDKDVKEYFNNI